jgi:RNA polymerase sigma-70 factor (ECF subfamily)
VIAGKPEQFAVILDLDRSTVEVSPITRDPPVPDWNRILDEHGPVVWRQALRMLGNEADAADCYQAVILEAFEGAGRREIQDWRAFLRRLTVCRSLDRLRDRYRRRTGEQSIDSVAVAGPPGSDPVETGELAERLRSGFARLPPKQAEAFALRWVDGLTNEEVAERMEITPNHVAVLLHRARAALRSLLHRDREAES